MHEASDGSMKAFLKPLELSTQKDTSSAGWRRGLEIEGLGVAFQVKVVFPQGLKYQNVGLWLRVDTFCLGS